jgi:hypothetical protein
VSRAVRVLRQVGRHDNNKRDHDILDHDMLDHYTNGHGKHGHGRHDHGRHDLDGETSVNDASGDACRNP